MTDEVRLSIANLLASGACDETTRTVGNAPNPYTYYIRRFNNIGSRRTTHCVLQSAAALLGATTDRLDEVPWDRIRRPHLIELVHQMLDLGFARKSVKLHLTCLRGVIHQACLLQMVPPSVDSDAQRPIRFSPTPKPPVSIGAPASAVKAILKNCISDWRYQGVRDAAIVALIYWAGFQRAEAAAIDIAAINQLDWTISSFDKNNAPHVESLDALAVKYLKPWIKLRNTHISPHGPLFTRIRRGRKLTEDAASPGDITASGMTDQAIYYIITERCKQANSAITPRALRGAWIINNIKKQGLSAAMLLAGHADMNTTAAYARCSEDEIREAMLSRDIP